MSVVFCESTRNMTLKKKCLAIILIIGWLDGLSGASFSNVVVQRSDVIPVEYISNNPPQLSFADTQIAQLSTAPLQSVISVPSTSAIVSPCLAPCVVAKVPGSGLASIPTSNAKIITYKSTVPSVPVVVANKEAARGYQYAYAVYDDQTGDKKYQNEQSDGSVVQGQYSFVQPDGIRREVVYTADDLKGFNAIVRNIPPELQSKEGKVEVINNQPTPCADPKNEQLNNNPSEISEDLRGEIEEKTECKNEDVITEKSAQKVAVNIEVKQDAKLLEEPKQPVKSEDGIVSGSNAMFSYNDLIKCLPTKVQGTNIPYPQLAYVLIPSLKGFC